MKPLHSPDISETASLVGESVSRRNAEIFACVSDGDLAWTQIASWLRIHLDRGAVTNDFRTLLIQTETALLDLIDRAVITFALRTEDLEENIARLRQAVAGSPFVLPDAPMIEDVIAAASGPTEDELDQAIITDWKTLPMSTIKSKWRDPVYKARFDRLMAEDRLGR